MLKTLTSFFGFYYYVIKGSPKKYNILMDCSGNLIILITPLFLFFLSFILMLFLPQRYLPIMYLWIPVIVGNVIFSTLTRDKGYRLERERIEEKYRKIREERERQEEEEREREQEGRLRKLKEEYFKYIHEQERQRQQRSQQHREQFYQQKQPSHDTNFANALHLMGLKRGVSKKEVKSAYRKLSKIHHPDMGGKESNFIKLNKAYNYLMERV